MKTGLTMLAASALTWSTPAAAAVITYDVSFSAATGGPITSHNGSFVLLYDDVANFYMLDGSSLDTVNFTLGTTTYNRANTDLTGPISGDLHIGGSLGTAIILFPGLNDWFLIFNPAVGTTMFNQFVYQLGGEGNPNGTGFAAVTVTQRPNAAVPEPASWALMLIGFGAVGLATRRVRRRQRALS